MLLQFLRTMLLPLVRAFGAVVSGEGGANPGATIPAGAMSGSRISQEGKTAIQRGLQDLLAFSRTTGSLPGA